MKKPITSLEKGLDILCSFDFAHGDLSAQTISERLKLPLSTTYRYIQTLEKKGFLTKNAGANKYKLGLMLLQLGNIVASQMKMVDIVMPHMKALALLSGETVLLNVAQGWESVCIEKIDTPKLMKVSHELGSSLPLHAGASSKILLASQEDSFIDSMLQNAVLARFTENTITDPVLLKEEMNAIREQGFAFSDREVDSGARAIAAPIFDFRGKVVAGITVAGPSERIDDENKFRLIQVVKDAAKGASSDLAYSES